MARFDADRIDPLFFGQSSVIAIDGEGAPWFTLLGVDRSIVPAGRPSVPPSQCRSVPGAWAGSPMPPTRHHRRSWQSPRAVCSTLAQRQTTSATAIRRSNAGEELTRPVWGTNGNCTIPANATAIAYNLTIPTSISGFLTIFPADAPRPTSSSINPVAGESVKANGGIVGLSATGAIKLYTLTGPTNAILDITGYFTAAGGSSSNVIPSGQTVTGEIIFDGATRFPANSDRFGVTLPGTTPTPLTNLHRQLRQHRRRRCGPHLYGIAHSSDGASRQGLHLLGERARDSYFELYGERYEPALPSILHHVHDECPGWHRRCVVLCDLGVHRAVVQSVSGSGPTGTDDHDDPVRSAHCGWPSSGTCRHER